MSGFFLSYLPKFDFGFHHDIFLRLMVPPIVLEAALNIDKHSFFRHWTPIVLYAVVGTLMSSLLTAAIVYYGTYAIPWCTSIPLVESLTFGSLISSIDPVAVLSVLSNMGMGDKHDIYVLIFGESLLNDAVAIVLFETLVHFLDTSLVIDGPAIIAATLHFIVIASGSVLIGLVSSICATIYFWSMKGVQTPLVEVLMFLCWAFIPYYICDGVEWSGIVAIVVAGFLMDIFIVGGNGSNNRDTGIIANGETTKSDGKALLRHSTSENLSSSIGVESPKSVSPSRNGGKLRSIFAGEGLLSPTSKNHIVFVTEINSTLMETAIFSYLGLFLFSVRYHWSFWVPTMAIISCLLSRTIMVTVLSRISNLVTRIDKRHFVTRLCTGSKYKKNDFTVYERPLVDTRMQVVLIFAGLRGAMSFALVETIPMYDTVTGQGSRLKPELKAMTSACIVFTIFILGGSTYYLLDRLGMSLNKDNVATNTATEETSKLIESGSSFSSRSSSPLTHRPKKTSK